MPTFVGDPVAESTFAFAADNDLLQVSVSKFSIPENTSPRFLRMHMYK